MCTNRVLQNKSPFDNPSPFHIFKSNGVEILSMAMSRIKPERAIFDRLGMAIKYKSNESYHDNE